jgi:Reverse transcriptase (RNA-dependent DNA polymerase)/Ulp1 protease family, C-terminal catalytic domain
VETIQHIYASGDIPTELNWAFLAVIPKPQGGSRGIGILETLWKVIEAIIDTRISKSVQFHDILHGFRAKRGTGTAIIEAKLHQELSSIQQKTLYQVFIDLSKAYDTLHRGRALATLSAYGIGPRTLHLIKTNWSNQQFVPRQSGFHGPIIRPHSGNTQGGIFSPNAFNIQIDSVIRHWLHLTLNSDSPTHQGLGRSVEHILALFYADDGCISTQDHEWLQHALNVLSQLFQRIGLYTNTQKTALMTSQPPTPHINLSKEAYQRKVTGLGPSFQDRQKQVTRCPYCDKPLRQASLRMHLRRIHGIFNNSNSSSAASSGSSASQSPTSHTPYRVSIPKGSIRACPVPQCHGSFSQPLSLRRHFMTHHPYDSICILEEGGQPLTKCTTCGMHTTYKALNGRHIGSKLCQLGAKLKAQRAHIEKLRLEREITIKIGNATLPTVPEFCYLGRILTATNSDWPAVHKNLLKARSKWALISRPLIKTGVSPRYIGYFYKSIVQSVLLYGSESWVLTTPMLKALNGFHHRIARKISGLMPTRIDDNNWYYPPIEDALEIAGLYTITEYIRTRQNTLAAYVATRPILQVCQAQEEEKASYNQSKLFRWWSQPHVTPPLQEHDTQPPPPTQDTPIVLPTYENTVQAPTEPPQQCPPTLELTQAADPPLTLPPRPSYPPICPTIATTVPTSISSLTTSQSPSIPPLRPQERITVMAAFSCPPSDQCVSPPGLPLVTLRSLLTLRPHQWLVDEVINCYMALLTKRPPPFSTSPAVYRPSFGFSTFFYSRLCQNGYNYSNVASWGSRQSPTGSIFDLTHLFIPVHTNNSHWSAVSIHMPSHTLSYLDSLGNPGIEHLSNIKTYLTDEFRHTNNNNSSVSNDDDNTPTPNWLFVPTATPLQTNNDDCGVYMCFFANRIFQNAPISASPEDITTFREYIASSILSDSALLG